MCGGHGSARFSLLVRLSSTLLALAGVGCVIDSQADVTRTPSEDVPPRASEAPDVGRTCYADSDAGLGGGAGAGNGCDAGSPAPACDGTHCECASASNAEAARGLDPGCSNSADPFVAALEPCPGCGLAGAVIVVGNRGGMSVPAGLEIELTLDGSRLPPAFLPMAIEPGGLAALEFDSALSYEFGFGLALTASVELDGDCNAINNTGTTQLFAYYCRL
jgi:hypothetical protein